MKKLGLFLWFFGCVASASELTVLSFNVGLLRTPVTGDLVPAVKARARILPAAVARFAADHDVSLIVLQEVWEADHLKAFSRALSEYGYETVVPRQNLWVSNGSGLLMAYRTAEVKLVSSAFEEYPRGARAGAEKFAKKGVIGGIFEAREKGERFYFGGTHMQILSVDSRSAEANKPDEVRAHQAQVEVLRGELSKWAVHHPAILVGDFNVGKSLAPSAYDRLQKRLQVRNALLELDPSSRASTWDRANTLVSTGAFPNDPSALIDHCFLRDGKELRLLPLAAEIVFQESIPALGLPLSDHYGILVRLEIRPR